ncbi:probable BOI-related E3 ubiquitin-protein ligase 3 [Rhodamnia argentea]|uniref:Probable BOI-related E3 ubiquitin-protein ligase 3 n=1 Tax=Rhodamnia argentea TaxID=178133 RepID=A0A8B8NZF8_9MYRT|nr:probable BOI-related E3 ubiquitin-protein ligase 3 [Rhodamnia argentea]XP_048130232.1 probable BOI-related E3 ubiquitin-protein ligase 3 [Rhodamnia argentea]
MAVDASSGHLNLFALHHFLGNRELLLNPMDAIPDPYNAAQLGCGLPLSGTTTATDSLPLLQQHGSLISDSLPPKAVMKPSDSGLTHNLPSVSRKRGRDSINPVLSYGTSSPDSKTRACFSFLGEDVSMQIQQQQLDIDRLISHHMEKVRMEIEERRKRQARRIVGRIEEEVGKRLRSKEEEIQKIGKLNWALEERVKTLCVENQIWRDLAQANEATANALRTNLEQVLAQVGTDDLPRGGAAMDDEADDAGSCCGSNYDGEGEGEGEEESRRRGLGEAQHGRRRGRAATTTWCRKCGKEEASVLLLPCRHLCLCAVCGSSLHTCPLCNSPKSGSVHVNLS